MGKFNVKTLIFNYNLPDVSDSIYNRLIKDGFNHDDIVCVDNGSDKAPIPKNANFVLPWNIRLPGQAKIALSYLQEYYTADYYLIITTSVEIPDEYNMFETVENLLIDLQNTKLSFVTPSLKGDIVAKTNTKYLEHNKNLPEYFHDFHYQPIMIIISDQFLKLIKKKRIGYFNNDLFRGWGLDFEMQYISNLCGFTGVVSKNWWCYWNNNLTHKKKMADESRDEYRSKAWKEANNAFRKKYSILWPALFYTAYKLRSLFSPYPSNVSDSFKYIAMLEKTLSKLKF